MHIMTERGWMPLRGVLVQGIKEAPPRYRGPLPSVEAKAVIRDLEQQHAEWVARRAASVTATVTERKPA